MVDFHAKVTSVAKALVERTMVALVTDITTEALSCFKEVQRFGMGGMLRVNSAPLICHCSAHLTHIGHT